VTARLFGLLVLLTIVPAAFVLWFMNAAVGAETESARQRVRDAYRGQLRLVRERLDPLWRAQAAGLTEAGTAAARFERLVTDGQADGAVVFGAAGAVVYPDASARARLLSMDEQRAREPNVFSPLTLRCGCARAHGRRTPRATSRVVARDRAAGGLGALVR
jgi:hypothetical protein